jgi:hypothetical protein
MLSGEKTAVTGVICTNKEINKNERHKSYEGDIHGAMRMWGSETASRMS